MKLSIGHLDWLSLRCLCCHCFINLWCGDRIFKLGPLIIN